MVTGELTEKLQVAIEAYIIPQLQKTVLLPAANLPPATTAATADEQPVCTLVFDREAYEPAFFERLWTKYKIAILTYRKNVKDIWAENLFKTTTVQVLEQSITMRIAEQKTTLGGVVLREIRRLTESGHQTAIITNNTVINTEVAAGRMFGRWSQENFFRYLIMDYDFDKMIQFGTEKIDENKEVVNPPYRRISHQIKKEKEKIRRLQAKLYPLTEACVDALLEQLPGISTRQMALMEEIKLLNQAVVKLEDRRKELPAKIKLKDMPDKSRYNKLKQESKVLMNVIKMVCYRAETAVANELGETLQNQKNEKRMLVKQIIQNNADLVADYDNKTLTVILHSLSAPRFNQAAEKLAELLNQTETVFPGTDLTLKFKTTAVSDCDR